VTHGVRILGWVDQVGDIRAVVDDPAAVTLDAVEATPVRCPDAVAAARMIELIERVRGERDSIGGAATIVATGVPPGWGEPVFDKLKADLGKALFSLPAVLGVEYGAGFGVVTARGSENNDPFVPGPGGPTCNACTIGLTVGSPPSWDLRLRQPTPATHGRLVR
jgi:chorismate synthase